MRPPVTAASSIRAPPTSSSFPTSKPPHASTSPSPPSPPALFSTRSYKVISKPPPISRPGPASKNNAAGVWDSRSAVNRQVHGTDLITYPPASRSISVENALAFRASEITMRLNAPIPALLALAVLYFLPVDSVARSTHHPVHKSPTHHPSHHKPI